MQSLLLDTVTWDLVLDALGNIAVASDPYAVAQDVACALRTFAGEVWYDNSLGLPYWTLILGHNAPVSLLKKLFEAEALKVYGVSTAQAFITGVAGRRVTGQVQITTTAGASVNVGF